MLGMGGEREQKGWEIGMWKAEKEEEMSEVRETWIAGRKGKGPRVGLGNLGEKGEVERGNAREMAVKETYKEINRKMRRALQPSLLCTREELSVPPKAFWPQYSYQATLCPSPSLAPLLPQTPSSLLLPSLLCFQPCCPFHPCCLSHPSPYSWTLGSFQKGRKEDPVLPSNLPPPNPTYLAETRASPSPLCSHILELLCPVYPSLPRSGHQSHESNLQ